MRLIEFKTRAAVYQKWSAYACLAPLRMALLCLLFYAPFQAQFRAYLSEGASHSAADVISVLPMALPVACALLALIPLSRRVDKAFGIPCPHCGEQMQNHKTIVIASHNCPNCGKQVLEAE